MEEVAALKAAAGLEFIVVLFAIASGWCGVVELPALKDHICDRGIATPTTSNTSPIAFVHFAISFVCAAFRF